MKNSARHTYLINRVFQIRFILKIIAMTLAATAFAGLGFYLLADSQLDSSFFSAHRDIQNARELLVPAVALAALVTFAVVAVLSVFITVRETHRLAGPLFRFEKNIRSMAEGRLETLTTLRKGDELRGLATALNQLSAALQDASRQTQASVSSLRSTIEEMKGRGVLAPDAAQALEQRIAEVESSSRFFAP